LLGATDYRQRLGLEGLGFGDQYPHDEVARSNPTASFTKMFGGDIVLIPRHMNEVIFIQQPIAFNSSFNALYFGEDAPARKRKIAALRSIARFLDSDVARYLYALFGKTRLLDRARFERNDLTEIPFPFADTGDSSLTQISDLNEDDLTRCFADKVGLDKTFSNAVREYANFRRGYEDAQISELPDDVA
jgi:hypothetical protein